MRRELFLHYSFWFTFFVLVILLNQYFNWSYLYFVLGGIIGTILPDIDHLLYVYLIKPQDLSSQRFDHLIKDKNFRRGIELLYETRSERKNLIFHSIFFQAIFFVVLFWVLTSSGSLFGRGVALAFAFHLAIDQMIDINELGSFDNWFTYLPFKIDFEKAKIYWIIITSVTVLMGIFLG